MTKSFTCLFLLLISGCGFFISFSSFCVVRVSAETYGIDRPSAPEFTVEFVDSSYDVPPTYKIDPYTGKNVTDKSGYTVENKSIVITIKNQVPTYFFNGAKCYVAYNIAVKGHFEEEWRGLSFPSECTLTKYFSEGFTRESDSDYTVVYCPVNNYPMDAQVDVKVQAYVGRKAVIKVAPPDWGRFYAPIPESLLLDEDGIIFGTAGDWSKTQTITVNPHAPIIDQLNLMFNVALILTPIILGIVLAAGLGILIHNKRKHSS